MPMHRRVSVRLVRAWVTAGILLAGAVAPAVAEAQSHWGVAASFIPQWTEYKKLREVLIDGEGELEGSQVTIGIARGSVRGGDWGVSFVRMPIKDGAAIANPGECEPQPCQPVVQTVTMRGVHLQGVEGHWSPTFVNIGRVQVGATIGGGIGMPRGTVEDQLEFPDNVIDLPNGQLLVIPGFRDSMTLPVEEVLRQQVPLVYAEAHANVIAAPGLKVRVSGGLNGIGTGVRIGLVYLIGAN